MSNARRYMSPYLRAPALQRLLDKVWTYRHAVPGELASRHGVEEGTSRGQSLCLHEQQTATPVIEADNLSGPSRPTWHWSCQDR